MFPRIIYAVDLRGRPRRLMIDRRKFIDVCLKGEYDNIKLLGHCCLTGESIMFHVRSHPEGIDIFYPHYEGVDMGTLVDYDFNLRAVFTCELILTPSFSRLLPQLWSTLKPKYRKELISYSKASTLAQV